MLILYIFTISYVCLQHKKPADSMLLGCSSRRPDNEGHDSPKYSDRLSPSINTYLSEASRQEVRVCFTFFLTVHNILLM